MEGRDRQPEGRVELAEQPAERWLYRMTEVVSSPRPWCEGRLERHVCCYDVQEPETLVDERRTRCPCPSLPHTPRHKTRPQWDPQTPSMRGAKMNLKNFLRTRMGRDQEGQEA